MGLSPPNMCDMYKHIEQVVMFAVPAGEQPSPNPLARFQWAARRGGEGNMERGKREEE